MYEEFIESFSAIYKVEEAIIRATIEVESNWNPLAIRYEKFYRYCYKIDAMKNLVGCTFDTMAVMQRTSFGLMQVMGANFYALGGDEEKEKWATSLLDPYIGIKYGTKLLALYRDKYGDNPLDIYSSYNQGSPRKIEGQYMNASAVNRFKVAYIKHGGKYVFDKGRDHLKDDRTTTKEF